MPYRLLLEWASASTTRQVIPAKYFRTPDSNYGVQDDEIRSPKIDGVGGSKVGRKSGGDDILLSSTLMSDDGVIPRAFTRGRVTRLVRHGDEIDINPPFQSVPNVTIKTGGVTYRPGNVWGTEAQVDAGTASDAFQSAKDIHVEASVIDLTASGGFARLLIRQVDSSTTPRSANFEAGTITQVGVPYALACTMPAETPSNNNQYTVHFSVSVDAYTTNGSAGPVTATLTVAIDVDTGTGPVEVMTIPFSDTGGALAGDPTVYPQTVPVTISGLAGGDEILLRAKSLTFSGKWATADFVITPDTPGVEWQTSAASDKFASMTPGASDFVEIQFDEVV